MSEVEYFDPREVDTMPGLRDLVSFTRTPFAARAGCEVPLSPVGIDLGSLAGGGAPEIVLHEFGNRIIHPNWNAQNVLSPFWRLYHNAEGGASISVEGREISLEVDKIYFIAENTRFDCRTARPVPHLWLHFTLRPHYAFQVDEPVAIPLDSSLAVLLEGLRAQRLPCLGADELRTLYFAAMGLLYTTLARAALPLAKPLPPSLREVLQKIERSPHENLSNDRLARLCGVSRRVFSRLFVHHLGLSPRHYVQRTRLNYASRLLAFTEMSIEQIAEETGFPNRHYLTRMFVRAYGVGPATFRRAHQSGEGVGCDP